MSLSLARYRRIAVKIGSATLVDRASGVRREWLASLVDDIATLTARGAEVLIVSSGAIALGRSILGLKTKSLKLEESQAAAAVGQIALATAWSDALARHGLKSGQVLLTLGDTEERRRYLNARATIATMLNLKVVPVINENDTVATSEIRYGDNDRLAARVATMTGADLLVLLSDIDGLYTAPPGTHPNATFIPVVERITPDIEAMAGGAASELSRGGMRTKIDAGKIATVAGTAMIIARAGEQILWRPLSRANVRHSSNLPENRSGASRPGSPAILNLRAGSLSMRAPSARCSLASRCLQRVCVRFRVIFHAAIQSPFWILTDVRSRVVWLPTMRPTR
jgi:glutamate 5-kinase